MYVCCVTDPSGQEASAPGKMYFPHEESPAEVFELPRPSESGDLQEEESVVVEKRVDLTTELTVFAHADVFTHFQTRDLVIAPDAVEQRRITVVHAQSACAFADSASFAQCVRPFRLVATERNADTVRSVFLCTVRNECSPAAAEVEMRIALVQLDLLCDAVHLVHLRFFECVVHCLEDRGRVNHRRTEERRIEVVTAVVVSADLFDVLHATVHDQLGNELKEEEANVRPLDDEAAERVPLIEDRQQIVRRIGIGIDRERHVVVEERFVERLNGNGAAAPTLLQRRGIEGEIALGIAARGRR